MPFERTEYRFTLPTGYVAVDGTIHKQGWMREESMGDTVITQKHPAVRDNPAYLSVMLLARVVTKLGTVEYIDTKVIEGLFASDFAYLMEFYKRINTPAAATVEAICPKCGHRFAVEPPSPEKRTGVV